MCLKYFRFWNAAFLNWSSSDSQLVSKINNYLIYLISFSGYVAWFRYEEFERPKETLAPKCVCRPACIENFACWAGKQLQLTRLDPASWQLQANDGKRLMQVWIEMLFWYSYTTTHHVLYIAMILQFFVWSQMWTLQSAVSSSQTQTNLSNA